MNKTQLAKLIRESAVAALKEWDRGDTELHQSANADQLLQQSDQQLDALKALAKALFRKQDPASLQMLKAMNASLAGFVQKVTAAVRSGKMS
jgi:hypothetical protein